MELELGKVIEIIRSEEELDGLPSIKTLLKMILHPILSARAAVRLTKESLEIRIAAAEGKALMEKLK